MKCPYFSVFIESFINGKWESLGVWRTGPSGPYMPHPLFVNRVDDVRTTLFGPLHSRYASWRAPGTLSLHCVEETPENLSRSVSAFLQARSTTTTLCSWVSVQEMFAYPWEETAETVYELTMEGAAWYDVIGVPRDEDLLYPLDMRTETRRQVLTPEDLWGKQWLRATLPKILACDAEDRVVFVFDETYKLR